MIRYLSIAVLLVLAASGFAQRAWWEQQNPRPQSTSLYDVSMLDATTYVTVGESGVVLKTTDDGLTWNRQMITQPQSRLTKVAFSPDKLHGITISTAGKIYCTTDAGATWELSPHTDTTVMTGICFRTTFEAYAVGRSGRFIKTTDAGKTWVRLAMEIPDVLQGIHFPDSLHGFICAKSGIFYTTTDGGLTWQRREFPSGNSLYAIHAANANEVIAVGETGGVFLSNDGGNSWAQQKIAWGLPFLDAVRINDQKSFTCGDRYSFFGTLNGGANWDAIHGGLVKAFTLNAISFAPGQQQGICIGEDGIIFRTTNGGDSWYRMYFNVAEEEALRGVFCLDSITSIAVGSVIVRTSDRGEKWEQVPVKTNQLLRGVDFPTREIGYAVGDFGVVMKTTDEGLTWKRLQTPFPSSNLVAVDFLNKDTGIAVASTDNGTIVQTWDGGITWKVGKAPFKAMLFGVCYLTPSTIVIGGFENQNGLGIEAGFCLRSTDGGWQWKAVGKSVPISAQCISFSDSLHGFIGGGSLSNEVSISATSDGGLTWKSADRLGFGFARGISSPDSLRATAVTTGGSSYHTTNAGQTWKKVAMQANGYAIHHPMAQSATAVGYRASIHRMTTTDPPLDVRTYTASSSPRLINAVYPNPAHGRITVDVTLQQQEDLVLRLYSVDGKFIRDLYSGKGDDAHTTIDCDLSGLRSGSYVLGASTFTRNEYHSIVILH